MKTYQKILKLASKASSLSLIGILLFNGVFFVPGLEASAAKFDGEPTNKIETSAPAVINWTSDTLNNSFNANRMVAVAWENNKDLVKKIWQGMDQDVGKVEDFLKKDFSTEGSPFIKSLKRFKEFATSDFMNKDLVNFGLSKSLWSRFANTDLLRVSEIYEYETGERERIKETANSDIEKYSFITLRFMWLVTKEGLYLVIGLPAIASLYSSLSVLELSWKIVSRTFVTAFRITDVVFSLFANIVFPVLSPLYPFLSLSFRAAGTVVVGMYQVVFTAAVYGGKAIQVASIVLTSATLLAAVSVWQGLKFVFYTGPRMLAGIKQFSFYFPLAKEISEESLLKLLNHDFAKLQIVERGYDPEASYFFMPAQLDGGNSQKLYYYQNKDSIELGDFRLTQRWGQYVVQFEIRASQMKKAQKKFPQLRDENYIFSILKDTLSTYAQHFDLNELATQP